MYAKKVLGLRWFWWIVILVLAAEAAVFIFFGESSYLGIHDNLDIHIVDYQIMKGNGAFLKHGVTLPLLGGISRDYFASELSLYTLLYMLLPNFAAYMAGHFLKIVLALVSCILLGRDILKEKYRAYEALIVLGGFAYGLLPLYPGFSFSFASIPLLIYFIRRILHNPSVRNYIFLFLYPLVSYFTFFGIFILGYLLFYTIYRWVKLRKVPGRLLAAWCVLFAGYAVCEYRLFGVMLFDTTETIRESMFMGSDGFAAIAANIGDVFVNGVFHADDVHKFIVLPVCVLYLLYKGVIYIRRKDGRGLAKDPFFLIMGLILFNCIVYGSYTWEAFRTLIETLLPPLKGWQFTRTVFFNPFLWYTAFIIVLKELYDRKKQTVAHVLMLACLLIVLGTQTLYNDFYNTVYTHTWMAVKGKQSESLSYQEFYSPELFEQIKKDISYDGAYAAAYGMHPAVLQYNGISTLDACLSYYSQDYKEDFRRIIAPALEQSEEARIYFDEWGARAYLFSGTDDTVWKPVRTMEVTDYNLSIDADAFRELGGRYLFSRIRLDNADELGLVLAGVYTQEDSPYEIYLYEA